MVISTTRFGTVEYEAEDALHMPEGMLGFPQFRDYVLVRHKEDSPFRWLQSVTEPSLAFLVVSPQAILREYNPTVADEHAYALGLTADDPVLVYVVVTIPQGNPEGMTANLAGPIIINPKNQTGRQIVVEDACYGTKHPVLDGLKSWSKRSAA